MGWIAYFEIIHEAEKKAMDDAKKDAEKNRPPAAAGKGGRRATGREAVSMGSHNR